MKPGLFGLKARLGQFAGAAPSRSCERTPSANGELESKPACDQAARLREALKADVATDSARVLVTGAKGGVGTTTIALALRPELAKNETETIDHGRGVPDTLGARDAWVLVTTPEPAALAAAFDVIRSCEIRGSGVAPLLVINRSPSFASSRRALERLGGALAAVGSIGTVFAGHVPFDPAFARASVGGAGGLGFTWSGTRRTAARRACRAIATRLGEFLSAPAPGRSTEVAGVNP